MDYTYASCLHVIITDTAVIVAIVLTSFSRNILVAYILPIYNYYHVDDDVDDDDDDDDNDDDVGGLMLYNLVQYTFQILWRCWNKYYFQICWKRLSLWHKKGSFYKPKCNR